MLLPDKQKVGVDRRTQRKKDLKAAVRDWESVSNQSRSPCNWMRLLSKFDDQKIQKLCGSDAALYLVFLRTSANFFLVITIVNFAVIALYLTGDPADSPAKDPNAGNAMEILTIINVDGTPWKVWVCFALSMFGVVPLNLFLISVYTSQFDPAIINPGSLEEDPETLSTRALSDIDIQKYALEIQGLKLDKSEEAVKTEVREILSKYGGDRSLQIDEDLLAIHTFKQYEEYLVATGRHLSEKEKAKLQSKINLNDHNAGFVFIIFKNKELAKKLCQANIFEHASLYSYKAANPTLRSKAPATEADIVWENILRRSRTTAIRQILTMVALILISFFLMTPATVLSLLNIVKSNEKDKNERIH